MLSDRKGVLVPSRYAQFKEKLPISRLSDDVLLAFRVLFDDPLDIVDLAQDIADLALYPERLQESYRKEWEAYVLKALAFEIRQHDNLSPAEFIELMMNDSAICGASCLLLNLLLLKKGTANLSIDWLSDLKI